MKILYSQIKELIPSLNAGAAQVGEALTMIGFMMESLTEVSWRGQSDWLISLEIRQNRADCLSVLGLAREVSAYYRLPLVESISQPWSPASETLKINIEAKSAVKRVLALRLTGLKNTVSPVWLKEWLTFYDLNSINLLVDLSNYAMIYTGYASHLMDGSKLQGGLSWAINNDTKEIITLDGSLLKLSGGELLINDEKNPIALAGLVGCQTAAVDLSTISIVAEMAVYDRALIKSNSRALGVVTEASNRLSKDLSPASSISAFNFLISLIIKEAGGQVASALYDYQPKTNTSPTIEFDPSLVARLSGIEIEKSLQLAILNALRCTVEEKGNIWLVTPPLDRLDLQLPEDLVEEIVRLNRYDKIPSDRVPALEITKDITPISWRRKESIRDLLVANGFDEVLSQPLVATEANKQADLGLGTPIVTQNSVNEDFPELRVSMATGLLNQSAIYVKNNIFPIEIFEIGRIFAKVSPSRVDKQLALQVEVGGEYLEREAVGILSESNCQNIAEKIAGLFGLNNLLFKVSERKPAMANPHSVWDILVGDKICGWLGKLKPVNGLPASYYAEIIINDLPVEHIPTAVVELTGKLVVLDTNIEAVDLDDLGQKISEKLNSTDSLWSWQAVDDYALPSGHRYTVRIAYYGLTDEVAKSLHQKLFSHV